MSQRDRERAKALEYARSEGWLPPDEVEKFVDARVAASVEALEADRARAKIADLEVALAAERESHAVTKRAVTRGTRARCAALEAELRVVIGEARLSATSVDRIEELLK